MVFKNSSNSQDQETFSVSQVVATVVAKPSNLVISSKEFFYQSDGLPQTVVLSNDGGQTLSWRLMNNPDWVFVSSVGGDIEPGKSVSVKVSLEELKVVGTRVQCITFNNETKENNYEDLCLEQVGVKTKPVATINSITPENSKKGDLISFSGKGIDEDGGDIFGYQWTSDKDGNLSQEAIFSSSILSVGTHVISFKVQDDDSVWSSVVSKTIKIEEPPVAVVKAFDCSNDFTVALGTQLPEGQECPAYVRMETGINIFGDAYTWWGTATSRNYPTGVCPSVSSVIIFSKIDETNMRFGHVGKVVAVNGDSLWIRDANWKGDRVVRLHKINVRNYKISGYIYCGYDIPECGGVEKVFQLPVFSADSLKITTISDEKTVKAAMAIKDTFFLGDSLVFSARIINAMGIVPFKFDVTRDGVKYASYSLDFNTEDELIPAYYPSYGIRLAEPGVYSCSFTASNRGGQYQFIEKCVVIGYSTKTGFNGLVKTPSIFVKKGVISFYLVDGGWVSAQIFDCRGRMIRVVNGNYQSGKHDVILNGLSSGTYLLKFSSSDLKKQMKINLF